jgi:hypothetical protein
MDTILLTNGQVFNNVQITAELLEPHQMFKETYDQMMHPDETQKMTDDRLVAEWDTPQYRRIVIQKFELTPELAILVQQQLELQQTTGLLPTAFNKYKFDCITADKVYSDVFIVQADYHDADVTDPTTNYCSLTLAGYC